MIRRREPFDGCAPAIIILLLSLGSVALQGALALTVAPIETLPRVWLRGVMN